MSDLPDYYTILDVAPSATEIQIKTAYKKAALKWHPDRVPVGSPERTTRTAKFQKINDAYYTLSDKTRRRDYDEARRWHTGSTSTFDDDETADEEVPRPPPKAGGAFGGFPWSTFGFGGGQDHKESGEGQHEKFSNAQFGSVFEEMMAEEGLAEGETKQPTGKFWSLVGGVAGATLGVIVGNVVGGVTGFVAGHQLGKVRDAKGKSVYAVFQDLDQGSRARLLSELAAKLFAGAIS